MLVDIPTEVGQRHLPFWKVYQFIEDAVCDLARREGGCSDDARHYPNLKKECQQRHLALALANVIVDIDKHSNEPSKCGNLADWKNRGHKNGREHERRD